MILRIENIRLRTIVGIYEWERKSKQKMRHPQVTSSK